MKNPVTFKNRFYTSLFITLHILSASVAAESSVWKISKGDQYFYLGGTIHLLNAEDHPLPQEFITAYKDSDQLIFETDLAETETPEFQQLLSLAMQNDDGETLESQLKKETYQSIQAFFAARNIPIENFSTFRPWAVSILTSLIEYQRLGMMPEYGVDEYFHKLALSDNKELGSLESVEEQLSFLQSMGKIEPSILLDFTLRDVERLPRIYRCHEE